jgi:hypothetical protein
LEYRAEKGHIINELHAPKSLVESISHTIEVLRKYNLVLNKLISSSALRVVSSNASPD